MNIVSAVILCTIGRRDRVPLFWCWRKVHGG